MSEIKLINGDCLSAMAGMPDKCYNLCIADPPYGINIGNVVGGKSRLARIGGHRLSCPKPIGDLMTQQSPKKGFLRN